MEVFMRKFDFFAVFALLTIGTLVFIGCDNNTPNNSNDSLVNIRVINETGRAIYNVRFTGSDGSVITVDEIARQAWGNRGQGQCWMRQDITYTLSWDCPVGGPLYAQIGGRCGLRDGSGRQNPHGFRFGGGHQRNIVLNDDNTWAFVDA